MTVGVALRGAPPAIGGGDAVCVVSPDREGGGSVGGAPVCTGGDTVRVCWVCCVHWAGLVLALVRVLAHSACTTPSEPGVMPAGVLLCNVCRCASRCCNCRSVSCSPVAGASAGAGAGAVADAGACVGAGAAAAAGAGEGAGAGAGAGAGVVQKMCGAMRPLLLRRGTQCAGCLPTVHAMCGAAEAVDCAS